MSTICLITLIHYQNLKNQNFAAKSIGFNHNNSKSVLNEGEVNLWLMKECSGIENDRLMRGLFTVLHIPVL